MNRFYSNYDYNDFNYENYMIPAIKPNSYENNKFVTPQDGFLKGNLEKNTYVPYKKLTYFNPKFRNEKDQLLYKVQEMCFAAHDINLYLDTHPNDINSINLFKEYNKKANNLVLDYEKKYGPIDLSNNENIGNNSWNWNKSPWPWEM